MVRSGNCSQVYSKYVSVISVPLDLAKAVNKILPPGSTKDGSVGVGEICSVGRMTLGEEVGETCSVGAEVATGNAEGTGCPQERTRKIPATIVHSLFTFEFEIIDHSLRDQTIKQP